MQNRALGGNGSEQLAHLQSERSQAYPQARVCVLLCVCVCARARVCVRVRARVSFGIGGVTASIDAHLGDWQGEADLVGSDRTLTLVPHSKQNFA